MDSCDLDNLEHVVYGWRLSFEIVQDFGRKELCVENAQHDVESISESAITNADDLDISL